MSINFLIKKIARLKYINQWIVFISDLILSVCATILVYWLLRSVNQSIASQHLSIGLLILSFLSTTIACFLTKTYKGIIRHSTLTETIRIAWSAVGKNVLMFAGFLYLLPNETVALHAAFASLDTFITFTLLVFLRGAMLTVYHLIISNVTSNKDKLLIYVGDATSTSLSGSLYNKLGSYNLGGYLRFGARDAMRIGGYSVYSISDYTTFVKLVKSRQIKYVLFTNKEDVQSEKERLIRYCEDLHLEMLLLPSVDKLQDGEPSARPIPKLRIEDLLGREEIFINMDQVVNEFTGKTIMVTGAAGSIGSELCRQLARMDVKQLILFDSAETPLHNIRLELESKFPHLKFVPMIGDVRLVNRLRMAFEFYHPQIIFHAAAYKHVPLMEENPCEAIFVNVLGTRHVADLAVEYGVEKMVMVSTDKAVNPTNIMGASKRLAEIYVQSLGTAIRKNEIKSKTKFITTRFGNVLGSNGSVIPRFKEQIENGGPVTVTDPNITRFFMTIPEACRLVMEAATMGNGNEIFVFEMGEPVKIYDLATRMIQLAGYTPNQDIKIEFTGLRPGEKLYEEVLSNEENTIPTDHKKIKIAKVRKYDYKDIAMKYHNFVGLVEEVDILSTVELMKEIVPEYISKNSVYEKLDEQRINA